MTNEQILKKAIEKAVKGGYKWIDVDENNSEDYILSIFGGTREYFSHDFAKAFWCSEKLCIKHSPHMKITKGYTGQEWCSLCDNKDFIICWQHHLQQLVLEKEPLKYLEKFLDNTTQK